MKKIIVTFVAIVTVLNVFPRFISAQTGCQINLVTLTGDSGMQSITYSDGAGAYVNVQTSGCPTASTFSVDVYSSGGDLAFSGNYTPGNENASNVNAFTIPLVAGEEFCESSTCSYAATVATGSVELQSNDVSYSCDGSCNTDWQQDGEAQGFGFINSQNNNNNNNNAGSDNTAGSTNITVTVNNPLTGVNSINEFLEKVIELALKLGIPLIALMIIYAGFLYVTARGDTGKIKTAHKAFLNALIGAAILLGAWVIVKVIQNTIDAITGSI